MGRTLVPYAEQVETFAWWEDGFTLKELDYLQNIAMNNKQAALIGNNQNNPEHRVSEISWLQDEKENIQIFDKLSHIVSSLNSQFFRFNLSCFSEAAQLTNYSEHNQGKYDWHLDSGKENSPCRKLSLVLQLTNPDNYEGGELQILTGKDPISLPKRRGLVTVFPSHTLHRVTPVTKGTRQSMVLWVTGEPFR